MSSGRLPKNTTYLFGPRIFFTSWSFFSFSTGFSFSGLSLVLFSSFFCGFSFIVSRPAGVLDARGCLGDVTFKVKGAFKVVEGDSSTILSPFSAFVRRLYRMRIRLRCESVRTGLFLIIACILPWTMSGTIALLDPWRDSFIAWRMRPGNIKKCYIVRGYPSNIVLLLLYTTY